MTGPWWVGGSLGVRVCAAGPDSPDSDVPIATFRTAMDAQRAVDAVNDRVDWDAGFAVVRGQRDQALAEVTRLTERVAAANADASSALSVQGDAAEHRAYENERLRRALERVLSTTDTDRMRAALRRAWALVVDARMSGDEREPFVLATDLAAALGGDSS